MPQLWVVAGPNGAGKTTLVSRQIARRIPVVNPDDIAQALPRINGRLDECQAGMLALTRRNSLLASGESFAIETTLSGSSSIRLMQHARRAGYKTTLVFVGVADAILSIQLVLDRVAAGGHMVPIDALRRRFPDTWASCR